MSKIHHKVPFNPFAHLEEKPKPVTRTRRETLGPLFAAVCALCKTPHKTPEEARRCEIRDQDQLGTEFHDKTLFER